MVVNIAELKEKWQKYGNEKSISGVFTKEELDSLPDIWGKEDKKVSILSDYSEEKLCELKDKWRKEEAKTSNLDSYWCIKGDNDGTQYNRTRHTVDVNEGYSFAASHPETVKKIEDESPSYALHADSVVLRVPTSQFSRVYGAGDDVLPTADDLDNEAIADIAARYIDEIGDSSEKSRRGSIADFSYKSRLRLLKRLSGLRLKGKYEYFVTLSYPGVFTSDMAVAKRDLDVFRKAIARAFPELDGAIWRLEDQVGANGDRHAPHYHFIFVSSRPISVKDKLIPFIKSHWPNIVRDSYLASSGCSASDYEVHYQNHIKCGENVQIMANRKQVFTYIAKYIAKVPDNDTYTSDMWDNPGRFWGMWHLNGKKLDFGCSDVGPLSREGMVKLKRTIKKHKIASNKLTDSEKSIIKTSKPSKERSELVKKQRMHKSDVRFSKRIMKLNTVTLFGYGDESDNGGVATRAIRYAKGVNKPLIRGKHARLVAPKSPGLLKCHISPACVAPNDVNEWTYMTFLDRVKSGIVRAPEYAARKVCEVVSRLRHYEVTWVPDRPCERCGCELYRPDFECCSCSPGALWTDKMYSDIQESKIWCAYAKR